MALNTNKREGDKLHAEEWNELAQEVQGKQPRLNIVDALDSTSSVDVLSAKQGKILNNKIEDTKAIAQDVEAIVKTLPVGYFYGTFTTEEGLPSEISEKGYAYVGTAPDYVIYTYEPTIGWRATENKYSTPALETNLETKSQTKAPTTKAVQEGLEAIDVTLARSAENENELTKAQKYNASANINDRTADIAPITGEVKSLGYKLLNPNTSFAFQVTEGNTIYEIKDEFSITTDVIIPANCTLNFNGGKISGTGTLTLANTTLDGTISFGRELTLSGKASNDTIKVEWLGAVGDGETDDSNALKNAIAILKQKNSTLVFESGKTYLHGDGIQDLVNDPDRTKHTGYSYPRASQDSSTADYIHPSGPAAIGRDIVLRFLGFDGLTIEGNRSTIVSNPNNGICMHNAMFFFGACANMVVRNLNVNGNRTLRVANAEIQFNDWNTGSYPTYPDGIIPSWMEQIWLESAPDASQKGYNIVSNMHVAACHDLVFENIVSTDPIMDGLIVNKANNGTFGDSYNISVIKSTFTYAARSGFDVGQGRNIIVSESYFANNGYYTDNSLDTVGSSNHGGFSAEMESNPESHGKISFHIKDSSFENNYEAHVKISSGVHDSVVEHCTFKQGTIRFSKVLKDGEAEWSYSENNSLQESTLYNCQLGIMQSGTKVTNNILKFDKDFNKDYSYDSGASWSPYCMNINGTLPEIVNPIVFSNNFVDVDITDLTKTYNGAEYFDATKTKGQGRIRMIGGFNKIVFTGNTLKNICPTIKSQEGFIGKSGLQFYSLYVDGQVENNNILSDLRGVYYVTYDSESYEGFIRINFCVAYSKYDFETISKLNNNLNGISSNYVDIKQIGTTEERPDIISIVGATIKNMKYFSYRNTTRQGSIEVFTLRNLNYTSITTITSNGANEQYKPNTIESGELKYFRVTQFPKNNLPRVYFTKISNAPEFQSGKYYKYSNSQYVVLSTEPGDWNTNVLKYFEKINDTYIQVSPIPLDTVLEDSIEVVLEYTSSDIPANNVATAYIVSPDKTIYPYILCIKDGTYSTATAFSYYDVRPYWVANDSFAAIDRKGSTESRPVGIHISNGSYVGNLMSNDVGLCYYDTDLNKPIYVKSVNSTNGSVVWADANGEPIGLQVSDTSVLIGAAEASYKTINVYSSDAITATAQNPDGSTTDLWLTASVGTLTNGAYPVTLTATSANTTSPRGAKVIVSNGTDVVIINVVQSY